MTDKKEEVKNVDIEDDIENTYSQEEINAARDELKQMTPEDLLILKDELLRVQTNLTIPEAVSICFTEVYSAQGNKINITCRGMSGKQAIDELASTMRYVREHYNMRPIHSAPAVQVQPPDSQPHYVPDEAEQPAGTSAPQSTQSIPLMDIDVVSMTRERKRDGKGDFLRVRGGMYVKYGAPAYDNVWPKGFDITTMQYGVEVNVIPVEFTHARIDTRKPGVHVVQFFQ